MGILSLRFAPECRRMHSPQIRHPLEKNSNKMAILLFLMVFVMYFSQTNEVKPSNGVTDVHKCFFTKNLQRLFWYFLFCNFSGILSDLTLSSYYSFLLRKLRQSVCAKYEFKVFKGLFLTFIEKNAGWLA